MRDADGCGAMWPTQWQVGPWRWLGQQPEFRPQYVAIGLNAK